MNMTTMISVISILLVSFSGIHCSGNVFINSHGNDLHNSQAGVDAPNATFLLADTALSEGVVFAYAAFIRELTPIRFQIWRFIESDNDTENIMFTLVHETRVIPSLYGEEVMYLAAKFEDCFKVKSGDRLGIVQEGEVGAISYEFDAQFPRTLIHRADTLSDVSVGDAVKFDSLVFPYDLSVQVYIHTDPRDYSPSSDGIQACPDLLVPDHDSYGPATIAPPVQGATGERGPTGPRGDVGFQGPTGNQGLPGVDGNDGVNGATGIDGADGATGADGVSGQQGWTGQTGFTGVQGVQGKRGEMGPTGKTGEQGPAGDATYVDSSGLFAINGDEQKLLNSDWMHIIFAIWLLLVTIVTVIVLICVCCWISKHNSQHKQVQHKNYTDVECAAVSIKPQASVKSQYISPSCNSMKEQSEMGSSADILPPDDTASDVSSHATEILDQIIAQAEIEAGREAENAASGSLDIVVVDSQI